jgi:hypothetical protein
MKRWGFLVAVSLPLVVCFFQSCTKVGFDAGAEGSLSSPSDTTDQFKTSEDTPLTGKAQSAGASAGKPSSFEALTTPSYGSLAALDTTTGEFKYMPNSHYFGMDRFQLVESNSGFNRKVIRNVVIEVARVGEPFILSDVFNFDINTSANAFAVQVGDNEVPNPWADISADGSIASLKTKNGVITKSASGFTYTPNVDFRGTDKAIFWALDSKGGLSSRELKLITGNPLQAIQPGMAVRASNCIQCHAQISSNFVTDFGYGDSYFFGHNKSSPVAGDWIYSLRMASNSTTGQYFPDWILSAAFANGAQLIVPKADLGFKYANYAPSFADMTAPWLQSTTIADLMTKIQLIPGATFKAQVVEKNSVYIGAPSIADLKAAGQLDSTHPIQYWKDSDLSYDFSGLTLAANGYFTNTDILACDGDLFVDGTVFLNQPMIKTISGCRLHATGVVFSQKAITFMTDPGLQANANLEIVSARAISMGVGLTQCEAQTNPSGWYNVNKVANPLQERFVTLVGPEDIVTRNTNPSSNFPLTSSTPALEGSYIMGEAQKIQGLEDASCHGRALSFQRLMLVAPQVHSRYKGNFSGVVIGEFPLFSLGSFIYQFDPVFLKVPVLPLLNMDKILSIQ